MLKFAFSAGKQSYSVQKTILQYLKSHSLRFSNVDQYYYVKTMTTKVSTKEVSSDDKSVNKEKKKQKSKEATDEVRNYFLNKPGGKETVTEFPGKLFRNNRNFPEHMYLADKNVADTIASIVLKYIPNRECVVLEVNPGIGLLSKCLIKNEIVQALHLYEPNPHFFNLLQDFKNCYDSRVNIFPNDFLSLWKMDFQDKIDDGTRMKEILSRYSKRSWYEEPALKIVAAIQTPYFVKHFIQSLTTQHGLMMHVRPEFLVMMPPSLYAHLTCNGAEGYHRYRCTSVLFQVFFDYELIERLPRRAYVPWLKLPPRKRFYKIDDSNEDYLYMVKIVPKKDLYEIISPEKLRQFWFFTRHHLRCRSSKLISEMESWIPGCGIRLILEGYHVFTEIGELKPQEILHVFLLFSSWPEFQDSSFLTSMETTVVKLEEVAGIESTKVTAQISE